MSRASLADALEATGYRLEALGLRSGRGDGDPPLLVDLPGDPWTGRRLWVGSQVPSGAVSGDLWLDTCEVTPMLLVPREEDPDEGPPDAAWLERMTPWEGWLAIRPVQRWQYAAFMQLARLNPRITQLDPPFLVMDPERLLAGPETERVTRLIEDEARLCANWFGKAVCNRYHWQAARAFLDPATMQAFWGEPAREWAGGWINEECHVVVSPATLDADLDEEYMAGTLPPEPERSLFGEWARPTNVSFRTVVSAQFGLFTGEPGQDDAWYLPVRLGSLAPR